MNKSEFIRRREKLCRYLNNGEIMILFAGNNVRKSADEDYPFFTNRNFLYLTGIKQANTALLIKKQNDNIQETVYAMMPDEEREKWTGRRFRKEEMIELSGIESVEDISNFEGDVHKYLAMGKYCTVNLCIDTLTPSQPMDIEHEFALKLNSVYPGITVKNIYQIIAGMRRYKSEEEIEAIREGIKITNEGIRRMMKSCKPGMMEYQLESEFDYVLKQYGQRTTAFPSIIASGFRNFYLHYPLPMEKIEDGDLVLTDVGSPYDDYCTDISRVFPSNGRFTERQVAIYNIAFDASRAIMAAIKPGQPFSICNEICRKISFEGLKRLGLIEHFSDIKKYVWHSTTHHIGLDTHDLGGYEDDLAENMVVTVDAGIYVREWGIGLRIEDDILVTSDGCENLSSNIPTTIEEIESLMR